MVRPRHIGETRLDAQDGRHILMPAQHSTRWPTVPSSPPSRGRTSPTTNQQHQAIQTPRVWLPQGPSSHPSTSWSWRVPEVTARVVHCLITTSRLPD